nr:MAG TPA: hypothetical protein [Caudoviricetes sp.]
MTRKTGRGVRQRQPREKETSQMGGQSIYS